MWTVHNATVSKSESECEDPTVKDKVGRLMVGEKGSNCVVQKVNVAGYDLIVCVEKHGGMGHVECLNDLN